MSAGPRLLITLTMLPVLLAFAAQRVTAEGRSLQAVRVGEAIVLDGELDDPAWAGAPAAADFVQSEPKQGDEISQRTEVRVVFDEDSLYVAAWCYDTDPTHIIANSLRPDFPPDEEDTFEVLLDTFSDSRGGFLFVTNPKGAKRDVQISSEGAVQNVDWDAVWEVSTRVTDQGWFAEIRIPFNTLRYYSPVTRAWHVNFGRRIRRNNEIAHWSPIPRRFDITRVSLAGDLGGLEGQSLHPGRNFWVKPYAAGRVADADGDSGTSGDIGTDLKYAVTNGLTLDVTVNPDFAQVEVDNQVINLDRFSLFFPEKREFFLENSGIFQVGTMNKAPTSLDPEDVAVFYSRRIGLSANRNPVPIIAGARLTGRAGPYQMGLLNIETGDGDGQDVENDTTLRMKRDVGARSEVGGFFLNRDGPSRPGNQAYGADAVLRPRDDITFNLVHARTHTPGLEGKGALTRLEAEYNSTNVRAFAVHQDVGENYRNDLGFVKQTGVQVSRLEVLPRIRPAAWPLVREITPAYNIRYMTDQHGKLLLRKGTSEATVTFRDGGSLRLSYRDYFDHIDKDFEIQDDVIIPKGSYNYGDWTFVATTDPSRRFSGTTTVATGDFWDGRKRTFQVGAKFRPNARLNSEITFAQDDVDLKGGSFTAIVSRLRLGYALSTRAFFDAFIQYNSQDERVTTNARFNLIHRPLSDIFVVYTEDRPTYGRTRDSNRVLSVKYTHLVPF